MAKNNKVALITGASDGLGEVLAQMLAAKGYFVWLLARNEAKLQKVVAAIRDSGGQSDYAVCDVTSPESVSQSFEKVSRLSGKVDVVVSNAGIWLQGDTVEASSEDIFRTINTNLVGVILVSQAALKLMLPQSSGHIVNVVSVAGVEAERGWSIYTASKYGARGFTDALKLELGGTGVKVSGIYPAGISTELFMKSGANTPSGQPWMMPKEDVASAIVHVIEQPATIVLDHVEIRQAG